MLKLATESFRLRSAESPANGMSHTIFELARNPTAQARLIQEVDQLGPLARPGFEDLPRLAYTEACFQVGNKLEIFASTISSEI